MKKLPGILLILLSAIATYGQQSSMKSVSLDDMSAFRQQAGNWRIVGDVTMDPNIDIHSQPVATETAGKGKKKKTESTVSPRQAVTFQPGNGILLNMNDATHKDQLLTTLEHGDIDLELEVMLPKGSNSGIYLQGRYEVQLLDSWGVINPSFSDIGGIYRNWEVEPGKIYMGKAPITNAAKAPGLWQKLRISFRAPKFDAAGKKIANARFVAVDLNGVRIHNDLEVPLPTGGPIENNEVAQGPLMIQGDHGPVAFRNIKYQLLKENGVSISDIHYKIWEGEFGVVSDFANLKPVAEGSAKELSAAVVNRENEYGVQHTGKLQIPSDGDYNFTFMFTGGGKISIDNNVIVDLQRGDAWFLDTRTVSLKAGSHSFEIYNYKTASWMPPGLGWIAASSDSEGKNLHALNSVPADDNARGPILVNPGSAPRMLRAFVDFEGDRSRRLTHTIGVGLPSKLNYIYDLRSGNLVCVWRGDFVDATPMWEDRGDGSFRPRGAPLFLFMGQPLSALGSDAEAFPVTSDEKNFRSKGYVMQDSTQLPVFKYQYKGYDVEDRVLPADKDRSIVHTIKLSKTPSEKMYYKLAEGSSIIPMPDGSFAVNDKQYYIRLQSIQKPVIRTVSGRQELVAQIAAEPLQYIIVW
jgi:hypothetical protein